MTIHPEPEGKAQGFAMVLRSRPHDHAHTLQFIADQRNYVRKKLQDPTIIKALIPFRSVASGINLRNCFKAEANRRLVETLGPLVRACSMRCSMLLTAGASNPCIVARTACGSVRHHLSMLPLEMDRL